MIVYAVAGVLAFVAILCSILPEKKTRFPKEYLHDNGRPLGLLEDALRRFHDENGFLILANALVLRNMKPLQESVVKKALELLAERHPMLRICIRKNNDVDYCFQKRHNVLVDLRQLDTSNWRNVMEESLLEKFDVENGPLWRLTFLPNARYETETGSDVNDTSFPHECICIFCFHHSIIDGTSYSRLFAEFVHHLNKLNKNEEPKVTATPMLPPCDVYVDEVIQIKWYHIAMKLAVKLLCFIPGLPKFIKTAMGEKENAFSRKHGMEYQRNPQIQPRTKIIPIEFTKEETTTFLRRCKEWQTTVQGAVQTAASVAMVDMMEEREFEVEATVTVNSRPFFRTKVPNEYVGLYFCRLSCRNKILSSPNPEQFWKIGSIIPKFRSSNRKSSKHLEGMKMSFIMRPVFTQMSREGESDRGGRDRTSLLVFSNLGYCKFLDGTPDEDVILRAMYGCSAEHQHGPAIFGNNLATFNGKLFWTIVYYSNLVSDATAQKCADLVKETILNAIKNR
ncbi:unnamed protein product [Porites lobata]|uniref:Condensation domain-containing protein n=1 Tax=Porites lobata TaxID=104759 RepID=A0ABN8N5A5_9CNID|nr:unnamed protein product [Porites lobata]